MQTIEKLKTVLAAHRGELEQKYKIKEIGIFGSYARHEEHKRSDLDVLVTFTETPDLFQFLELENLLTDLLSVKVDLVMKGGLRPQFKDKILSDIVYI